MRDRSHTARMLAFSLVFTPYLWNAVVSGKSPFLFSCFRSPQAAGIAHRPPRSLYCENKRRQPDTDGQTSLRMRAEGEYKHCSSYISMLQRVYHRALAYPGGVLRVLEYPPKRFLLGVAIGFIPLQTISLNIQSSFTQLHRLRGKKATRCHTSLPLGQSSPRAYD